MEKLNWTRINNDVNGNPRYVVHFLSLLSNYEKGEKYPNDLNRISTMYADAVKRAKKIGGRKFHNKQYGGGIVFQSYSLPDTEKGIFNLIKEDAA